MSLNEPFGRRVRRRRLYRHAAGRLVLAPLDHSVTEGPIVRDGTVDDLVSQLAESGVDGIVVHKGALRHLRPHLFDQLSVVVHLNAGTARAQDPHAKRMVAGVGEALRLGADAVSLQVNLGSRDEGRQLADLAAAGRACDRWNVPLLAMAYPRGPGITDPHDPQLVAHAVTVAAELGADLVKTVFPGSSAALAEITRCCPIPVLIAGGAPRDAELDLFALVAAAMAGGAGGVAVGRGIFRAGDPAATARKISDLVHGDYEQATIPGGPR